MVTKVLVDRDLEAGRFLVEALDRDQVPVSAALWIYEPDEERYRLFVATTIYDQRGPLEAYRRVQSALEGIGSENRPSLSDINVVSPTDQMVVAIRKAIKTGPGISGIRFSRNTIDNVYVEDAYVYRLT